MHVCKYIALVSFELDHSSVILKIAQQEYSSNTSAVKNEEVKTSDDMKY